MENRESIYEDASWEAYQFESEELSINSSIVARGQFGASFVLGRIRPHKPLSSKINTMTMMKSCMENEEGKCYNGLKSELNVLYDLCHRNVIQLIGYCLVEDFGDCRLVLVFEYCANGNLHKVLQKGRPYYNGGTYSPKKAINNEILSPDISLNLCDWHLLRWATEIARGMEYLSFKGVIHGDLAARNILLTCDWTAKICNFGIAQRQNAQESYALNLPKDVLPIAWMAPEAIQNFVYSERSDVWSYAVTLWEIYTLGEMPYREEKIVVDTNFFVLLLEGVRPSRPSFANDNIWTLIKSCWSFQAEERPTFSKIKTFLDRNFLATTTRKNSDRTFACGDSPTEGKPKRNKTVTFDVQSNNGGFIQKCFYIADEVLAKTRMRSGSSSSS